MRFETAIKRYPFLKRILNFYPESQKRLLQEFAKISVRPVSEWVYMQNAEVEEYESERYNYEDVNDWFLVKDGTISDIPNSYRFYRNGKLIDSYTELVLVGERAKAWGYDYIVCVSFLYEDFRDGERFDGEIVIYEK